MTLTIGFSYPRRLKIGAWLISKWIGKPYSHVYIKFESASVGTTIYQASHSMVHFTSEARFLEDNNVIKEVKLSVVPQTKLLALRHAVSLAGESYGYLELGKIFLFDAAYRLGLPLPKFADSRGFICSELVGKLLTDLYGKVWHKPQFLLRPDDIEEGLKDGQNTVHQD